MVDAATGPAWAEGQMGDRMAGVIARHFEAIGRDEVRAGEIYAEDAALEADEAWPPVLTPDGPGTLVWSNSD